MLERGGTDFIGRQDEWLVVRCQLGERPAFDELIQRWHEPLWRYVRRLTGEDEAAKDIVQDVWLRVLRGISRLRDGSKLRSWLFGIARRASMDRLREQYATPIDQEVDVTAICRRGPSVSRRLNKPDDVTVCVSYRCNQLTPADILDLLLCSCASVEEQSQLRLDVVNVPVADGPCHSLVVATGIQTYFLVCHTKAHIVSLIHRRLDTQ